MSFIYTLLALIIFTAGALQGIVFLKDLGFVFLLLALLWNEYDKLE